MFDSMSIRKHAKFDGDMRADRPSVAMTGTIQPENIVPLMRASSKLSSLWNRLRIIVFFVDSKTCNEVESSYDETLCIFFKILEVALCSDVL